MKTLSLTIVLLLFIVTASNECQAQNYATVKYWGKEIPLDRSFFEILNNHYKDFMGTSKRKYSKQYSTLFQEMVGDLRRTSFTVIVNEDYSISVINPINMPGFNIFSKATDKRSKALDSDLLFRVLLPSLKQFVNGKI